MEGANTNTSEKVGTEDASYFNHQPPPVATWDQFEDQPTPHGSGVPPTPHVEDAPEHEADETAPHLPPTPPRQRARFPDEPHELAIHRTMTPARKFSSGSTLRDDGTGTPGEKDNESTNRGGIWRHFREFWTDLKSDFGAVETHQEVTNVSIPDCNTALEASTDFDLRVQLIGDTGIDVHTLRKLRSNKRLSSLVGSSLLLSSAGYTQHNGSTPSVSGGSTGASTPSTPWRRFQSGVDAKEISKALQKLKNGMTHPHPTKESKYVAAKSDLNARRTLALLLTYAFMLYGAPSHRIEEYILQLFKVCGLDGRVNYIVGCTEICFINPPDPADPMTRQSYTTLVKAQGLDVGALEVAFHIYKDVIHGEIAVEEATKKLVELVDSPAYHKPWWLVPCYGAASAFACVWAYNGYWPDMAISFLLGCIVGLLVIIVAARNPLYANVLETTAALVTSFGARAFATIGGPDQKYFCFAAIAESSITTILPGYIVLCGALELQSKSVTAGSTRLFYAVMYSLFLGYGINVGSQLWGVIDTNAPTSATCPKSVDPRWKILLVPCYLVLQATLIRSRPKQIPIQVLFGSAAYTVNYFVSKYATSQVADTASAFTLGVLGHLYARSRHAFAFASVVAGIMVLVPSGLSAEGGLVAGITEPLFNNGTTSAQQVYEKNIYSSFSVGAQMIQVAVGLSVGLFISALAIYPLGRKNNALFSF